MEQRGAARSVCVGVCGAGAGVEAAAVQHREAVCGAAELLAIPLPHGARRL